MKITESDQTGGQNGWEKIGYAKTTFIKHDH
jgi:hypothetical protein